MSNLAPFTRALDVQARVHDFLFTDAGQALAGTYSKRMTWDTGRSIGREERDLSMSSAPMSLKYGSTFAWSGEMCALLSATAHDMPDYTLSESDIPAKSGFMWFETPLALPGVGLFGESPMTAFSWMTVAGLESDDDLRQGQVVVLESEPVDYIPILLIWIYCSSPLFPLGAPVTHLRWTVGEPMGVHVIRLSQKESPDGKGRAEAKIRYVAASLSFLSQHITQTTQVRAQRHQARRVSRSIDADPLVRVVKLRTVRHEIPDDQAVEHRDYSCQWIVRGHWRQQWYPKLGTHQPKWITPYVKGPDDKPLKTPRANVFAVVR